MKAIAVCIFCSLLIIECSFGSEYSYADAESFLIEPKTLSNGFITAAPALLSADTSLKSNTIVVAKTNPAFVCFFPGVHYPKINNQFTSNYIGRMKNALNDKFMVIEEAHRSMVSNLCWSLKNGSNPIKENADKRLSSAVKNIVSNFINSGSNTLNIVGSSYGSVVAAQTALHIAENRNGYGITEDVRIYATLVTSMVSDRSQLFQRLLDAGVFVIYHEVQDADDNVTGMAGTKPSEARHNAFYLAFPWLSKRTSGPSIFSKKHIHRVRAEDLLKAEMVMHVSLVTGN